MTAEEVFGDLFDRYGEEFDWHMVPLTDKTFVEELKREIGKDHFLYGREIWAVAKCDARDDVLYLSVDEDGKGVYYIFHLTYSGHNLSGFPRYKKFSGIKEAGEYIEQEFTIIQ